MSTRLTKKGIPMVESQSLALGFSTGKLNEAITRYLVDALAQRGYASISSPVLGFLSALDCDTANYASELARNLGVSRQMVAKTVKELCQSGYLEQRDSGGKQKHILFTEHGEQLMSDARILLAELDQMISSQLGQQALEQCVETLSAIYNIIPQPR